jgi:hypothetical protein
VADWAAFAGVAGEVFPAGSLWGYLPTAISLGLMAWFFVLVPRLVEASAAVRPGVVAAGVGLVFSWLHPWQGVTAILVVLALALSVTPRRRAARLVVPGLAVAAPLAYYAVLARADGAWEVAQRQTELPRASAAVLAVAVAPALVIALAARGSPRLRPRGPDEVVLVAWPLATLVNYALISSSVPGHALEGLSIPLAVLGVRSWPHLGAGTAAGAAIVLSLTAPGMVLALTTLRDTTRGHSQPFVLRPGEADALRQLRGSPARGGVLTSAYLGAAVPAFTGRRTWVGHPSWTPDYGARAAQAENLLEGRMPDAGQVARAAGARFVVADCSHRRDLTAALAPARVRHWGCATVYDLGARP